MDEVHPPAGHVIRDALRVYLPGQPGDVLSPVPSLAEGGDTYEYIRGIHDFAYIRIASCCNSESEK